MSNSILIRPLERGDITESNDLLSLLGQLTNVPISEYSSALREDLELWFCGNKTEHILIAMINDKMVGTAKALMERKIARLGSWVLHIEDVVTLEEFRSKGIATKILKELEKFAITNFNTYKQILDCDEKNVPFYTKSGFTKDSVCMRKDIK